jgi:hypothetical protein
LVVVELPNGETHTIVVNDPPEELAPVEEDEVTEDEDDFFIPLPYDDEQETGYGYTETPLVPEEECCDGAQLTSDLTESIV